MQIDRPIEIPLIRTESDVNIDREEASASTSSRGRTTRRSGEHMLFNIIEFTMMRGVANSITGLVSNQIALNELQSGCNVRSHPVAPSLIRLVYFRYAMDGICGSQIIKKCISVLTSTNIMGIMFWGSRVTRYLRLSHHIGDVYWILNVLIKISLALTDRIPCPRVSGFWNVM